ncbi:hypothetical protein D3C81_1875080 [compost metagenome]
MIATLSIASCSMIATLSLATATLTTVAATFFGIHAGETADVIGHQYSRCRQDCANCQSQ